MIGYGLLSEYRQLPPEKLLVIIATRKLTHSLTCASAVLTLWHFSPWFEAKIMNTQAGRDLRGFKGFRWIGALITEFAADQLCAYVTYNTFPMLRQHFPSSVHMAAHVSCVFSSLCPWLPWPSAPILEWSEYTRVLRPELAMLNFYEDVAAISRGRITTLVGLLVDAATGRAERSFASAASKWVFDGVARLSSSYLSAKLLSKLSWRPGTVYTVTYLTLSIAFIWAASLAHTRVEKIFLRPVVERRAKRDQEVLENVEVRDAVTKRILEEDKEEEFQLRRMETTQITELRAVANAVAFSTSAHNAARLAAMKSLNTMMLYEDGIARGEMSHGAEQYLDQVARSITFSASHGVESSITNLTNSFVGTQGKTHTMTCAVCLDDYKDGDQLLELVCGHLYHDACIREWLGKHKQCPCCRHDVRAEAGQSEVAPETNSVELISRYLRKWGDAELPGALPNGNWGAVANWARLKNMPVPEELLNILDEGFERNNGDMGKELLITALVCFAEATPSEFDAY
jgi:hypothetical protein